MAIKVNSNTAIDDSKNVYLRNVKYTGGFYSPYGFTSGGANASASLYPTNTCNKYPSVAPFTTATDVGNLFSSRWGVVGHSSSSNSYHSGGSTGIEDYEPGSWNTGTTIDTFLFASPFTTATDAGDLSPQGRLWSAGHESSANGFTSGGAYSPLPSTYVTIGTIDTFPFSSPFTTATTAGSLTTATHGATGHSSSSNGYFCGGFSYNPPKPSPTELQSFIAVYTFSFSNPIATLTDVGDIAPATYAGGICGAVDDKSNGYGYRAGATSPPATDTPFGTDSNRTDKFPFASPFTYGTDVGNIGTTRHGSAGSSSDIYGFAAGGWDSHDPSASTQIDQFPFSAPFTTATDVGDLVVRTVTAAGTQGI